MSRKLFRKIVRKNITVQEKSFSKLRVYINKYILAYDFMKKYYFNVLECYLLTVLEPMFIISKEKTA